MRLLIITAIVTFIFISCKNDRQKFADKQYADFKEMTSVDHFNSSAETIAEYLAIGDYDDKRKAEVQMWLRSYRKMVNKQKEEQWSKKKVNESRLYKLGGCKLVDLDTTSKCNLYKAIYRLNKYVTDSADLTFLAKHFAQKTFESSTKGANCPYLLMSQVFIYQPNAKNESQWASMCTISPGNYDGEVTIQKMRN